MSKHKLQKHLICNPLILFFHSALLTVLVNQAAFAQIAWYGVGQVIRGPGQGNTVELTLEDGGEKLCIRKGPSQGNCIGKDGKTPDGRVWKVSRSSESMRVILYTLDDQIVDFNLHP